MDDDTENANTITTKPVLQRRGVEPTIDDEFANLLPPLAKAERAKLKALIETDKKLLHSIVVWPQPDGPPIIIDGHTRLEICQELGIEPEFTSRSFASREEAKRWAVDFHQGRRNVVEWKKILDHLESPERAAIEAEAATRKSPGRPKGSKNIDVGAAVNKRVRGKTADQMSAEKLGVSEHTIKEAKKKLPRNNDPKPGQGKPRTKVQPTTEQLVTKCTKVLNGTTKVLDTRWLDLEKTVAGASADVIDQLDLESLADNLETKARMLRDWMGTQRRQHAPPGNKLH